ncbi:hypothetical protein WJX82_007465 [Trebouxia sp. C0006]
MSVFGQMLHHVAIPLNFDVSDLLEDDKDVLYLYVLLTKIQQSFWRVVQLRLVILAKYAGKLPRVATHSLLLPALTSAQDVQSRCVLQHHWQHRPTELSYKKQSKRKRKHASLGAARGSSGEEKMDQDPAAASALQTGQDAAHRPHSGFFTAAQEAKQEEAQTYFIGCCQR